MSRMTDPAIAIGNAQATDGDSPGLVHQVPAPTASAPRTRRSVIAGALGGLMGLMGSRLVQPDPADAVVATPLYLGQANDSGTAQTTLTNAGLGAAFTLKSTNPSTGATGIFGWTSQTGANASRGVYGKADGANSDGIQGRHSGPAGSGAAVRAIGGNNDGVVATTNSSSGGAAIRAAATGSGPAIVADAIAGDAITAETSGSSAVAVRGHATSLTGQAGGVLGQSDSTSGVGVFGRAIATSGFAVGVFGVSDSATGFGLWGTTSGQEGENGGVWGESGSTSGVGLFGRATATSGGAMGVFGQSNSPDGTGVYGHAGSGTGVYGYSQGGSAGVFAGDVQVTGTISKGGGSFRIDHPLDPAGKYLSHSFVESPDMKNIYDGIVTTDAAGVATVELPAWFAVLNRDLRYQLTPVGAWTEAWIADELNDGRFTIATVRPNAKISWQVTGIRQDAFANAHRIKVEEAKSGAANGKYLHPDLYGRPESDRVLQRPKQAERPAPAHSGYRVPDRP